MLKDLQITVQDNGILHYGRRVYALACDKVAEVRGKCPICDDTQKITVREMVFDCPYCRGVKSNQAATMIVLRNYVVDEYTINKIVIEGPETKTAYNKDGSPAGGRYPGVFYGGFTKSGNGYNSTFSRTFSKFDFRTHDPDGLVLNYNLANDKICFLEKKDAQAFVKRLHERQAEMLETFDAEHGTSHTYPFEY